MKTAVEIITKHFNFKEFFDQANDDDLIIPSDKLIDAMEEYAEQFKTKWISAEDELPKESGLVEICLAGTQDIYIAFYKKMRNVFQVWGAGRDPIIDMKTTHWKLLTKPPMYKCRELDCENDAVMEEYPGNAYYVCGECFKKLHSTPPQPPIV